MKIALLTEKYPPIVGGGETHLHQLATGLASLGHEVVVLTEPYGGDDAAGYRSGPVAFVDVPGIARACQQLECYDAVPAIHAAFDAVRDADVVHVFNHVPAMLTSWLRPAVPGVLAVSLFETLIPGVRVFDLWRRFDVESVLQRGLVRGLAPDGVVCGSEAYRRWALLAGFPDELLHVVPFATDVDVFAAGRRARDDLRSARGWDDRFVFLVPARPVRRKRFEDALHALARVGPGVHLVVTAPEGRSDADYVAELRALADGLGVADAVTWEPALAWRDMPALYGAADAVVLPSSHEGFGIALIEAMAARLPVITTAIEGHDEIVTPGVTGWLYEPGDVGGLAAAMVDVMGDASAVVAAADELVRSRFSLDAMVRGHERVYAELVAGGASRW